MLPLYNYSDAVRVTKSIYNDGTYPGLKRGVLLVKKGSIGDVQNVGRFLQDQIIYIINFMDLNRIVGCRESELIPAEESWIESEFEFREHVRAGKSLAINGSIIVEKGQEGEVLKVIRNKQEEVRYHVWFNGHTLNVPEQALCALETEDLF